MPHARPPELKSHTGEDVCWLLWRLPGSRLSVRHGGEAAETAPPSGSQAACMSYSLRVYPPCVFSGSPGRSL